MVLGERKTRVFVGTGLISCLVGWLRDLWAKVSLLCWAHLALLRSERWGVTVPIFLLTCCHLADVYKSWHRIPCALSVTAYLDISQLDEIAGWRGEYPWSYLSTSMRRLEKGFYHCSPQSLKKATKWCCRVNCFHCMTWKHCFPATVPRSQIWARVHNTFCCLKNHSQQIQGNALTFTILHCQWRL